MREIKFRAWEISEILTKEYTEWCKTKGYFMGGVSKVIRKQEEQYEKETGLKTKETVSVMRYDIHLSRNGEPMHLLGGWDYIGDDEESVVMQYTGLKDKNGKEIYEGDILKTRQGQTVVYWEDGSFKTNHINTIRTLCHLMSKYQVKIIGNIYENPELLTTH